MQLTPTLRIADPSDFEGLRPLFQAFFDASPFTDYELDMEKAEAALRTTAKDRKNGIVFLTVDGDKVVGLLAAAKIIPTFSNDPVALEIAWYIYPEHRSSERTNEILEAYEQWAKMIGCKFIQYSLMIKDPAHAPIMARAKMRNFKPIEQAFQKRIE